MAQPFIYIGTYTIKAGRLDEFKQLCEGIVEFVHAREPGMIAFNFYCDEASNEVSCVQVHPHADSMVNHMNLLGEHMAAVWPEDSPIAEILRDECFGPPTDTLLAMLEEWDPGVPKPIKATPIGGFARTGTG